MARIYQKACVICGKEFTTRHPEVQTCSMHCRKILRNRHMAEKKAEPEEGEEREYIQLPDGTTRELRRCKVCGKPYIFPHVWQDEDGIHSTGVECCCIRHTDLLYGSGKKAGYHDTKRAG